MMLLSCTSDKPHRAMEGSDYEVGGTYRLKRSVVVAKRLLSSALVVYDPVRYPKARGTSVPVGTLIQVFELKVDRTDPLEGVKNWVFARFVDGPLAGRVAELSNVSSYSSSRKPSIDTNIVERVTEPDGEGIGRSSFND
jgi:hypothetical protein